MHQSYLVLSSIIKFSVLFCNFFVFFFAYISSLFLESELFENWDLMPSKYTGPLSPGTQTVLKSHLLNTTDILTEKKK